jgi:carbon-monoxide dehydrogenase medium subunit
MAGAFTTALRQEEILTAVRIPRLSPQARWSYYKVSRKAGEFALALAGIVDDPARGLRRALIGAIDGAPHVFDAGALIDHWHKSAADIELKAAGLRPGTYEYQIHATALARAVASASAMRRPLA